MNKFKKVSALVGFMLMGALASYGVVPAEITAITEDAATVWATVSAFIAGVVGFMIVLSIARRARKG